MSNYDYRLDPLVPKPQILVPPPPRTEKKPTDVTDFPAATVTEIPEEFHYPEGKYRPPSLPYRSGFIPFNTYLEAGKLYRWCSCGATWTEPFCDHKCHFNMMRLRPIVFNVNQSGYYKLCNCKQSANAPFCNNTHKLLARNHATTHFGLWRTVGGWSVLGFFGVIWWNYYS